MRGRAGLANDAWEALLGAHATRIKEFAAEDIWGEVSMREYDVLYTLSKERHPIPFGELHRQVLLSQPAMSRLVDRLVNRGLMSREVDPSDARRLLLTLTDTGRQIQRGVGRRHARSVAAAMTSRLDDDEMVELQRLCSKLTRTDAGRRS